ncbi:MAG: M20/M25/M40 family metallo-hydrolase [Longimicrobiales bacterium]
MMKPRSSQRGPWTATTGGVGLVGALLLAAPTLAYGQSAQESLEDEAVQRVMEYLRIDTTNPPGNESRGVDFFAEIFEAEGIEYETAESAPGRGNIWARLEGGDEPALILIHHIDVVPADERYWTKDALSGELADGFIYGRGALDTKAGGILHLQTFLSLHRSDRPLNRDVIFMATADEEAGGFFGAGWLVENRPEIFEDVGFLLNEGGGGADMGGRVEFSVEVTQKVPFWFRLHARGEPGHGSRPLPESSVTRLVRALDNLREHPFEPRIIPAVDQYFKGLSENAAPEWAGHFRDIASAVQDPAVLGRLQAELPGLHTLTRNTCSMTVLEGSNKINVVPPEATAELDCRLLPDQDPDAFKAELTAVLDDPSIEIEQIMGFSPAVSSTDTPLFESIKTVATTHFPEASVLPMVQGGFTDSHFFRDLGIVSYGFFPTVIPVSDQGGVHGNDERISEENVRRGTRMMLEIVETFVVSRSASQ